MQDATAVYGDDYWIEEGAKGDPIEKLSDRDVQIVFGKGVSHVAVTIGVVDDGTEEDIEHFTLGLRTASLRTQRITPATTLPVLKFQYWMATLQPWRGLW